MIITTKKDFNEIKKTLRDMRSVFLIGCSECASLCGTGDQDALDKMKADLAEADIQVTGTFITKTGCQVLGSRRELRPFKAEIDSAEAILAMSCGAGAQSLSELFTEKPVFTANDSRFLGNMSRFRQFDQRCSMCGKCVINETGGICPVTRCPKGLLNGPCGGVADGRCEVYPDAACIWVTIYDRLEKLGMMETIYDVAAPKDYRVESRTLNLAGDKKKK